MADTLQKVVSKARMIHAGRNRAEEIAGGPTHTVNHVSEAVRYYASEGYIFYSEIVVHGEEYWIFRKL